MLKNKTAVSSDCEWMGCPIRARSKKSSEFTPKAWGLTWEQFHDVVAGKNHRRRRATLAEVANVAAFHGFRRGKRYDRNNGEPKHGGAR